MLEDIFRQIPTSRADIQLCISERSSNPRTHLVLRGGIVSARFNAAARQPQKSDQYQAAMLVDGRFWTLWAATVFGYECLTACAPGSIAEARSRHYLNGKQL